MSRGKNVLFGGTLAEYRKRLVKYEAMGADFRVVAQGQSRVIVFGDGSLSIRFFGTRNKKSTGNNGIVDGAYFAQMLRRQVDQVLQSYSPPPVKLTPDVQSFNIPLIEKSTGKTVLGIDINACYWTTAHKLGYIDRELYVRGVNSGKKKGLLISIGCLNKRPVTYVYQAGKKVEQIPDDLYYEKYSPVYWHIITHVWELMVKSWERFGQDNWYMWLTDCLYVNPEIEQEVIAFFKEHGFFCKTKKISFDGMRGSVLEWFDHESKTSEPKRIGAAGRDIQTSHYIYKKSKVRKAKKKGTTPKSIQHG